MSGGGEERIARGESGAAATGAAAGAAAATGAAAAGAARAAGVRVVLLNGPNLNLLGEREPLLYGTTTLADIERAVEARARARGAEVRAAQSNHEGALLDLLHEERHRAHGFLLNAGAYTHTSYALRDAIAAIRRPVVEVHLTDLARRAEPWRRESVLAEVCAFTVMGLGAAGYVVALDRLLDLLGAPAAPGAPAADPLDAAPNAPPAAR